MFANGQWFKRKPIIVFLNKMDLFKAKLATSPISRYFPDYSGDDTSFIGAIQYFSDQFCRISEMPDREIYIHRTNATDTTLLIATMRSIQDMIIRKNLHTFIL